MSKNWFADSKLHKCGVLRRIGKPLDRVSHDATAHRAAASPFLILMKAKPWLPLAVPGSVIGRHAASPIAAFGKPAGSLLVLALVAVFVQSIEQMCAKGADADATSLKGGER